MLRQTGHTGPTVALAHRRLAIIDLTPAASQPMLSEDGRLAVVLNGEIYNYRELRLELERSGRRFRSASDTEVLLQGFAEWGRDLLPRLVGMFAFGILDSENRHLLLVRDPFGIKPLLLARNEGSLAFASEIGALLALIGGPPAARSQSIVDFLQRHDTDLDGPTMFAGVERLPAGHCLDLDLDAPGDATPTAYWRLAPIQGNALSFSAAATQLQELLLDEIRLHLRSDVPLGFALSGGLDSSAIICGARRALGPSASLHAFTYVPDDPALSEEPYAVLASNAVGAELHRVTIRPEELAADFADLAWHQGEPFHGPTVYAQRRVFQHAAGQGIKVLLEGQGGDELLGGYDRYLLPRAASLLRRGHPAGALKLLSQLPGSRARTSLSAVALACGPVGAAARQVRRWTTPASRGCLEPGWLSRNDIHLMPVEFPPLEGDSPFKTALIRSVWGNPLQALLRFGDRNAMAASLENRVPFLTPRLATFLLSLPEDYLLASDGTRKAVLRAALRDWVPAPIIARRDKVGFATPVVKWLIHLKPWVEQRLRHLSELPLADMDLMTRQWQAVQVTRNQAVALQVWRWLSLGAWVERFGVRIAS